MSLDAHTVAVAIKLCQRYIQNSMRMDDNLDFMEGYLYGLMKVEEDLKTLHSELTKEKGNNEIRN